jgi:uncharacterized protein (DUF1778 family)
MPKTKRWGFRIASETDHIVRHAASTANTTLPEFVVDAAVTKAERVLADRNRFGMDPVQWALFADSLDRPPQDKPGLERLFSKPSVFSVE